MGFRSTLALYVLATTLCTACAQPESVCPAGSSDCITHPDDTGGTGTGTPTGSQTPAPIASTGGTTGTTAEGTTTGGTSTSTTSTGGTPTKITATLVVDDFTDPTAFANHLNSLQPAKIQSDNGSMTSYALNANRLQLDCAGANCFWYSLLAAQGTCSNITGFTHIAVTLQAAAGADATLQLQNNDAACDSTTYAGQATVDLATYTPFDGAAHTIFIPLSAFTGVDLAHSRAIAVLNLVPNITLYMSDIRLVVVSP